MSFSTLCSPLPSITTITRPQPKHYHHFYLPKSKPNSYPFQFTTYSTTPSSSFTPISTQTAPPPVQKSRVEYFTDKINQTPVEKRVELVEKLIEKNSGMKKIAYFNDLMMGLVRADEIGIALKVFDEMSERRIQPDHWSYSILIRCYCKGNDVEGGERVLECMIRDGLKPNVVTLTVLINSFCSVGRVQKSLGILRMMQELGCKPNVQTWNCVLKGLCYVGRVEEAYKMLVDLKKDGTISPDIYSYTSVIDGFCRVGRTDEALELLNEVILTGLTPNVVTYNSVFIGFCKEGKPGKGITLLKQMEEQGCRPDYISYSTLLHGLLRWGKVMVAYLVYEEMIGAGFRVDERMVNSLLRGLCRRSWKDGGVLKTVYGVFDQMKSWGYAIYPETQCLMIQSYCVGRKAGMALARLHEMVENGDLPRMVVVNRVIRGLCDEGRIGEALSVLVLVRGRGRIPSKIGFNLLIDEYNKHGDHLGAACVYGSALKLGVIPHTRPVC